MSFLAVALLATLAVVVALNWRELLAGGALKAVRLGLIWAVIIVALVLLVTWLGLDAGVGS